MKTLKVTIKEQHCATSIGIMQAENLCRFMSSYGNDEHKGTKNSIITIRALQFRFLCNAQRNFSHCFIRIGNRKRQMKESQWLQMKADAPSEMPISTNRCWLIL